MIQLNYTNFGYNYIRITSFKYFITFLYRISHFSNGGTKLEKGWGAKGLSGPATKNNFFSGFL